MRFYFTACFSLMDKSDNNQSVKNIGQKFQKKGEGMFPKKTTETGYSCLLKPVFPDSFSAFVNVVSNGKKERNVTLKRRAP